LSGSGKTTLANRVEQLVKERAPNLVSLDGDAVREAFGNDLGYEMEDRKKNAVRLSRLGRLLERQGIHVVAAVASSFEETRRWNRDNLASYYEVVIQCPRDELVRRDPKGLYARALRGEIGLVGVNQPYEEPKDPDMVVVNDGDMDQFLRHADTLAAMILASNGSTE
jgi:adenylylsulfate kinase